MKQISKVFAGSNYCYGLNETTNELWSWGFGYNYVLGTKEEDNCWIPTLVHHKMMYE